MKSEQCHPILIASIDGWQHVKNSPNFLPFYLFPIKTKYIKRHGFTTQLQKSEGIYVFKSFFTNFCFLFVGNSKKEKQTYELFLLAFDPITFFTFSPCFFSLLLVTFKLCIKFINYTSLFSITCLFALPSFLACPLSFVKGFYN
jgi:hypothetical protein